MYETMFEQGRSKNQYVGYEYRDVVVNRKMQSLYADSYESFGWQLDKASPSLGSLSTVSMKFKRDRKIRNKAELTRLQRQFDACINQIEALDRSKYTTASIVAYVIGIIGCAFMAGSVFAFTSGMIPLCIILAVPGFFGWIVPYFAFGKLRKKRSEEIIPLVDQQYDQMYEVCEKASALLG